MGAGISQKDLNRKLYTRLKAFQRQLARAGIAAEYKSHSLHGETVLGPFCVYYRTIRASNGECASAPLVCVGPESFGGFGSVYPSFEKGFAKLLAAGKRPAVPVDLVPV
jgi:hypothetical protein